MKTMMKGMFLALLLIASGTVVRAADNALIQDEPLPLEVRKLIGMKIPPKVVGREPSELPKFIPFSSGMLNRKLGDESHRAELGYDEGVVDKKWPVFIVSVIHSDKTIEILDARLLPKNKVNWRYTNGKIEPLEKGSFYIFSAYCLHGKGDGRIVFGLEDPKVERKGFSTRIERAWEIDQQSGHIKSISTRNITCAILGE